MYSQAHDSYLRDMWVIRDLVLKKIKMFLPNSTAVCPVLVIFLSLLTVIANSNHCNVLLIGRHPLSSVPNTALPLQEQNR